MDKRHSGSLFVIKRDKCVERKTCFCSFFNTIGEPTCNEVVFVVMPMSSTSWKVIRLDKICVVSDINTRLCQKF